MEPKVFKDYAACASTSLAFVGDAVFSLYVRTRLINEYDYKSGELSRMSSKFVQASAQAKMCDLVSERLTEEENEVFKRARNTHTLNRAKNASASEYRKATAFEALLGFLYLSARDGRLDEFMKYGYEEIKKFYEVIEK